MSLCASCGLQLSGDAGLCPHHHCVYGDDWAVANRIMQDGKRGHSMGVKGTPTVFINGREVNFENLPADKLRVVIQNELRSAGK